MKALQPDHWLTDFRALFLAVLALCAVAIWNQQPFFYTDTTTYLRGAEMGISKLVGPGRFESWSPADADLERSNEKLSPASGAPAEVKAPQNGAPTPPDIQTKPLTSVDDKVVLAGRSVYYGVLLYAGYLAGGMWLAIIIQAFCVAYLLHLLMVRLWGLPTRDFVMTAAALSLLSPLGAFTGFLMPDIFAPVVILGIGILTIYWQRLLRTDRWLVIALLLFGLCAHASHVAMAALLWAVLMFARLLSRRWQHIATPALLVVAVCMAGAIVAEMAFNKAVTAAVGAPPLRLPHPMARLIDLGPGTAFLKQRCADGTQSRYAACTYLGNYPTKWEDFLFSTDPAKGAFAISDSATKRRLAGEQMRFAGEVLRFDPLGVIQGISASVLHQLVNFRVDVWSYGQNNVEKNYAGRVPDSVYAQLLQSRAATPRPWHVWLTLATYAAVGASLAWAAFFWLRSSRTGQVGRADEQRQRFADFVWIVSAGVVANAFVCAALASSMDRFQARVIWLVPFMAISAVALHFRRHALPARASVSAAASTLRNPSNPSLQGTTS
jgi:hypothetical protein